MNRLVSIGLAAAALAFGVAGVASGQSERAIERSGHTFHVKACPKTVGDDVAHCHAHIVTDNNGAIIEAAHPSALPGGYGPTDLRAAYGVSAAGSSTMTIAIVDAYGYSAAESDLATYRSTYGLPACTTANGCFKKYDQNGGSKYPRDNTGWSQETALDLDMASAMCPTCKIILVEANSASFVDLGTAVNRAATLGAKVISNSYGGGESGSAAYEFYYNHPGVAVTVSSGDGGYGVEFPASSPHVIAVGGTSLKKSGSTFSETAWSGAGSGCSTVYNQPTWQAGLGSCTKRTVADISAIADPNTGVAVYGPSSARRSAWMIFGGTSVAAPLIGGIYGYNGSATNSDASSLYAAVGAFHDVVGGSNGTCSSAYLCTAVTGYDGPTGLGTPNGSSPF